MGEMMKRHWSYLKYVLRHKWFVLREGLKIGVNLWQLIIHDWSKFLPDEWMPYAKYFYHADGSKADRRDSTGRYDPTETGNGLFEVAWLHHQNRNQHHWQYWTLARDSGEMKLLPMPDRYRREMLADWRGAGLALGKPDTRGWYLANRDNIQLHPETRAWIEEQLGVSR